MKPHPSGARILVEVGSEIKELDKVIEIIKSSGSDPVEFNIVEEGPPIRVCILLATPEMQEIVLDLSEAGFLNVKGINSSNYPKHI